MQSRSEHDYLMMITKVYNSYYGEELTIAEIQLSLFAIKSINRSLKWLYLNNSILVCQISDSDFILTYLCSIINSLVFYKS